VLTDLEAATSLKAEAAALVFPTAVLVADSIMAWSVYGGDSKEGRVTGEQTEGN
jgi:hypothetical protein